MDRIFTALITCPQILCSGASISAWCTHINLSEAGQADPREFFIGRKGWELETGA